MASKHKNIKRKLDKYFLKLLEDGVIDQNTYQEMHNVSMECMDEMYAQGLHDGPIIEKAL